MSKAKKEVTTKLSTELTPSEMKDVLRYIIKNNENLAAEGKETISCNLVGEAGIGKTSICKQVAEEFRHHFVRMNLAEIETPDLCGLPIWEYEVIDSESRVNWVSDKLLKNSAAIGMTPTGRSRTGYAKPDWIEGKEDKPVLLLLDDATRAMLPVWQAAMRIVDEQEYISWRLPKGSTVLLSSNPDNSDYLVVSSDEAMKTRYLNFFVKASVDDWAREFAEPTKMDGRCINFLMKHPEIIEGTNIKDENGQIIKKANLRIWTKFFNAISGIHDFEKEWSLIYKIGQNSLPLEHLMYFHTFIAEKLDKMPSVESLLKSKTEISLRALEAVVGTGAKTRTDLSSIISKRLLNYCLSHHESYTPEMKENYMKLMESPYLREDIVLISLKKVSPLFKGLFLSHPILQDKLIEVTQHI